MDPPAKPPQRPSQEMSACDQSSVQGEERALLDSERPVVGAMPQPLGYQYEFEGVPLVRTTTETPNWARCDCCAQGMEAGELFRPCNCNNKTRFFHRHCFRQWRQGWINPRNYFCCPDCMTAYRIERVKEASLKSETRDRIVQHFRIRMALFYLGMLAVLFALIGGVAGIAYGADTEDKNVPVGIKYMLTSVVNGLPPANATHIWRRQFHEPNVPVWPYYTLLGTLCAAILILIGFACIGCTFDERERPRRSCSEQCGCGGRGSSTSSTSDMYLWWGCYNCNTPCDACYCPCDECCDQCCGNGSSGGCGGGGGGGCGDCGKCDMKGGGEALIIILLIVIVIVLLSAIVVIILYTVKKWTLFHDRMTDMIKNQASELESETIVLGIDETLRPIDEV